MGMMNIFTMLP